jgi:glycosyltransferase involved in cell wall biosynthesis
VTGTVEPADSTSRAAISLHLAIVEPDAAGHHLALHVRGIAAEAVRRGWRLTLLTTAAATHHPAYDAICRETGAALTTALLPAHTVKCREPRLVRGLTLEARRWRAFRDATVDVLNPRGVDAVYVTSLEQTARMIALRGSPFGGIPFAGMYTKVRFHHRRMGVHSRIGPRARLIESALFPRLLAIPSLRTVPIVDEPLLEWARTRRAPGWRKLRFVRDGSGLRKSVPRAQARAQIGVRSTQLLILLYGVIAARKGVAELVAAVADPRMLGSIAVLIAGEQDDFTRAVLASEAAARLRAQRRLYEEPEFLDDVCEARAFAAADIVWLGYRDFDAMSGVMVQAGEVGLPCLATDRGLIAWNMLRHGLGLTFDSGRHDAAVDALLRLGSDAALRRTCGEHGRSFAAGRTLEQFGRSICDAVAGEGS